MASSRGGCIACNLAIRSSFVGLSSRGRHLPPCLRRLTLCVTFALSDMTPVCSCPLRPLNAQIVGGTGMTTAYQFIEHLASRASQASTSTTSTSNPSSSSAGPSQPSRVRILYAARSSDALFLADELLQLAKRCAPLADVSVRLWTDKAASQEQEHDQRSSSWSPWSWWRAGGPTQPATRFLDDEHIRAFLDSSSPTTSSSAEPSSGDKSRLVLVCGPDRCVQAHGQRNHFAY